MFAKFDIIISERYGDGVNAMRVSTAQEALNGNNNNSVITPLRLKQVLAQLNLEFESNLYIGPTEPTDTALLWFDTNTKQFKIYDEGAWVSVSTGGGGSDSGNYVTIDTVQDITGAKIFKNVVKIQNGQGTGTLWIGGDVNANTLTNNKRHLARIVVPSYADVTKGVTLLGFDSNTDTGLNVAGKSSDIVSFGGSKKITNATSPMALAFCVAKTRGGMAASEKIYPIEMDASEARFNVPPNYNGVRLVTTDDAPTQSLTNTEIETLINSIV